MIKLYTLRDKESGTTGPLVGQTSERDAKAAFQSLVNEKDKSGEKTSAIAMFPADHELFQIGTYDPREMKMTPLDEPILIVNGADLVQ